MSFHAICEDTTFNREWETRNSGEKSEAKILQLFQTFISSPLFQLPASAVRGQGRLHRSVHLQDDRYAFLTADGHIFIVDTKTNTEIARTIVHPNSLAKSVGEIVIEPLLQFFWRVSHDGIGGLRDASRVDKNCFLGLSGDRSMLVFKDHTGIYWKPLSDVQGIDWQCDGRVDCEFIESTPYGLLLINSRTTHAVLYSPDQSSKVTHALALGCDEQMQPSVSGKLLLYCMSVMTGRDNPYWLNDRSFSCLTLIDFTSGEEKCNFRIQGVVKTAAISHCGMYVIAFCVDDRGCVELNQRAFVLVYSIKGTLLQRINCAWILNQPDPISCKSIQVDDTHCVLFAFEERRFRLVMCPWSTRTNYLFSKNFRKTVFSIFMAWTVAKENISNSIPFSILLDVIKIMSLHYY